MIFLYAIISSSEIRFQSTIFSNHAKESCSVLLTRLGRSLPGAFHSHLAENKIARLHDEFTLLKPDQATLLQSVDNLNQQSEVVRGNFKSFSVHDHLTSWPNLQHCVHPTSQTAFLMVSNDFSGGGRIGESFERREKLAGGKFLRDSKVGGQVPA
jgi:hypothetical protein